MWGFHKKTVITSMPKATSGSGSLDQTALDAIAHIFRAFGRHSFAVDGEDRASFQESCERWARHLLLGTPIAGDQDAATKPAQIERRWPDAQRFFLERRRQEEVFVQRRLRDYFGMVQDLLDILRRAQASGLAGEEEIVRGLYRFAQLIEHDASTQMRLQFQELDALIKVNLEQQRQGFEQEAKALRTRLEQAEHARQQCESRTQALTRQLAGLHEDLRRTRQQMELDPLTRIYNRGAFDAALQRYVELAQVSGQVLALLMIDLDHFKRVNDQYGHLMGDRVLIAVADMLARCFLRKDDFIARYGGEEFVVLLYVAQPRDVVRLTEHLLRQIRDMSIPGLSTQDPFALKISCSVGYALLLPEDTSETLLIRADRALYQAKSRGRDRVEGDALPAPL